jgi:HlyD family secretion protein
MTLRRVAAAVVLLAVLGAVGTWTWRSLRPVPAVAVTRPERTEVVEHVVATGRLRAVRQSDLGAEVAGTVDRVLVADGDRVRAGQELVTLRQRDAEARVEQARLAVETARRELQRVVAGALAEEVRRAKAELARAVAARVLAERELERARMLFARDLVARSELDRAESNADAARASEQAAGEALAALQALPRAEERRVAEARLAEAEAALRSAERDAEKRVVRAPFAGLVVKRRIEPGQGVVTGQALLTLADMSRTELRVETDENNLVRLRPGQRATAIAPAYRAEPFAAALRQIGPEVDNQRGVVELRLDPVTVPSWARPDMTVDVSIEVARLPSALAVPASSLVERDGRVRVATLADGRVRLVPVRVLGRNPERAAVEGLPEGAAVIVRGADVAEGQRARAAADATR